jgi:hypothetical protein
VAIHGRMISNAIGLIAGAGLALQTPKRRSGPEGALSHTIANRP